MPSPRQHEKEAKKKPKNQKPKNQKKWLDIHNDKLCCKPNYHSILWKFHFLNPVDWGELFIRYLVMTSQVINIIDLCPKYIKKEDAAAGSFYVWSEIWSLISLELNISGTILAF